MFDSGNVAYEVAEEFLLIGRTFEEYRHFFDLDPGNLRDGTVLDCGAGPSSFVATASAVGADATAVDPMYGRPLRELEAECADAVRRTADQLREKCHAFEWTYYGDIDARRRLLRAAHERFLADYVRNPERYAAAALPSLPFARDAFDLALSAHLLFLYDDRLSLDFHVAALRELARVAGREVRLFPLIALDFERSGYVDETVAALRADGLTAEFVEVPFEFQPGATEALRISGVGGYDGRGDDR